MFGEGVTMTRETETLDKLYLEWSQFTKARTERELALIAALRNFADPLQWSDEVGRLQWMGKRHAIEFAASVLKLYK